MIRDFVVWNLALVIEEAKLTIHDIIFRMKNLILESAITFLVVIDPLALAAIFATFVEKVKVETQKKIALKAILISAIILISFALVGDYLLKALGISMQAFKIAGGILLLLLAIDMLFARSSGLRSTTQAEDEEAEEELNEAANTDIIEQIDEIDKLIDIEPENNTDSLNNNIIDNKTQINDKSSEQKNEDSNENK